MMRFFILVITLAAGLGQRALAAESDLCTSQDVTLQLHDGAVQACKTRRLEGRFQLRLCDNQTGTLVGENGAYHFLYRSGNGWMARIDSLDAGSGRSVSEVLTLDGRLTEFQFVKSISANNGTVPTDLSCSGTIGK